MFLIRKYIISGTSMTPLLRPNDRILASPLPYLFKKPKIKDIIVCIDPRNGKILIKRLIKIVNNKYFVAGENQKASTDSKNFGFLGRKDIIGKVVLIIPYNLIQPGRKVF